MHPDKIPLAFGIKMVPHHHTPFTISRDWDGFISLSLIAGLICIERWSYWKYPMPISIYGEGNVWGYFNTIYI